MQTVSTIIRALDDENRLRVLCALKGRELCVCQLTEMLELAPSTVSKHMSLLKVARLVEARKDGRWVYYRLPRKADPRVRGALSWLHKSLLEDPTVCKDADKLEKILTCDPEVLCQKQNRS